MDRSTQPARQGIQQTTQQMVQIQPLGAPMSSQQATNQPPSLSPRTQNTSHTDIAQVGSPEASSSSQQAASQQPLLSPDVHNALSLGITHHDPRQQAGTTPLHHRHFHFPSQQNQPNAAPKRRSSTLQDLNLQHSNFAQRGGPSYGTYSFPTVPSCPLSPPDSENRTADSPQQPQQQQQKQQ